MNIVAVAFGVLLTIAIYSYLLGDNPLYRVAVHLLVGVSAAYASLLVLRQVIIPIFANLPSGNVEDALWLFPILFGILLLLKLTPRTAPFGNSAMAILIGVGAAVALVGAISGTLLPQITGLQQGLTGLLSALMTVLVLVYFQMSRSSLSPTIDPWSRLPNWERGLRAGGRGVLMITFGAIFAGVINTSLILLITHVTSLANGLGLLVQ